MNRFLALAATSMILLLPGCISDSNPLDDAAKAADASTGNVTLPKTETEDFTLTASWATPVRAFNSGQATKLIKPGGNITGFIVEVQWSASNQASQRMSVWIRKDGDGAVSPNNPTFLINSPPPLKQADGASPIKVPLPADLFKDSTDSYAVILRASASPVGVAVNQPAKLHLTTFAGVPFNETFSAIPK